MEKNISTNRIKSLREDRDLRQIDVAQATGIDQRSLSNYENGKTNPDSYAIIKLADFFGVTCDYLLGVTDTNLSTPKEVILELEQIEKRIENIKRYFSRS
ncbi:MAG: helix-turn-helix transcriptional regulator [Clostridiales bacterium]|nr:helix-turn-helix transcriptional regulator [Clostridiales bacterium]